MTPAQDRRPAAVAAALRRAGVHEADAGTRRRAEYSSDASNYRVWPTAVVFPRHADDVLAAMDVARAHGLAVTSRGGGTSIAGNAVGAGLVLDFSRHLRTVIAVDPDARVAVVDPGATLDDVTRAAAPHGLRFGPDPSTHARATIGGAIGNNACGARALRYGRTSDNVVELDVVTGRGDRMVAGGGPEPAGSAAEWYRAALGVIASRHRETIAAELGRFRRQVSGYSLEHLLPSGEADVARFLVGTEGTLGVVLRATVRLVPSPPAVALAVLGYADMATAADAAPGAVTPHVVALEGMDSRLVSVVRERRGDRAVPHLPRGAGWLFVETAGASPGEAEAHARAVALVSGCIDSLVLVGAEAASLWRIREDGAGLGSRTPAGEPAWPGWEDAAVPPERLGAYLRDFEQLLAGAGLDALVYGHFGDGCVHARINFPLAAEPARFRELLTAAAHLVAGYGGSVSGEHGDGRARSELLALMYSPRALAAFGEVKALFDPDNRLNPGVIVDPLAVDAHLRLATARPVVLRRGFRYTEDGGDLAAAVHRCVGMGACRADNRSTGVMCPSYLATRDEKDSTRGRARVLQELAQGTLPGGFRSEELAQALELCLACKGCLSDCPTGVDMATYKAEALSERYRHRLRPRSHYALGWLPQLASLGAKAPGLVAASLEQPTLARLGKLLGGIDARRSLPAMAVRGFRSWAAGRAPTIGPPVLLWVDTFTEHFTPHVGQAAVRVLEHAGYSVRLTTRQVCCGLTWISTGQLGKARRRLQLAVDALEQVAPGDDVPIVGLEPSCTAVLRRDVPELLCDPRARRVAARVRTLAELLEHTDGWRPADLAGVRGVAQPHCHHHAVMGWDADARLLAGAGANVQRVGGCCGMAGNFGVEQGHYDVSVAVAETSLLPAVRAAGPGSVVLADGFSCRTQLADLAGVQAVHLAELLDRDGPTRAAT